MPAVLIPSTASSPSPHLAPQDVHVWLCALSRHQSECATLAALLSKDEQSRAARFAFERDRHRFTMSHGLLRTILSRYVSEGPGHIQFRTGPHGKPAVDSRAGAAQPIEFSLSHSGEYAVVAVATGRAVGVDIEVRRSDVDSVQLAQRFFAPGESRHIAQAQGEDRQRMFYRFWTAKEAYLKGIGVGLSLGLDQFELFFDEELAVAQVRLNSTGTPDKNWSVQSLRLADHIAGALAVEGEACRISILDATMILDR
ncbi:MAG: 4'-phosphopantetheinyl transferase superfamily protein [Nitrospirota bacterium]|nr:4'-phosphopantetheinyl transferase superfamily protein [Nitrospirota bacterium]